MKGSSFKRKLINARRVFVIGSHSFFRNAWLSVAATIVMTITLGCILVTLFASYTLNSAVQTFTEKIDVSIYFNPDVSKGQINQLTSELKNDDSLGVKEITYISSDEVKAQAQKDADGDVKILQTIAQANSKIAFPDTVRVKTIDTAKLAGVVKIARKDKYKDIVYKDSYKDNAKRTAVERLGNIAKFLQRAGLVASVLFGAISILVILNTIRMTIFNRKDEIEIMQLIGASKWYIRGPFLIEASIYGAIAGILASIFFFGLVLGQAPKLGSYVEEISPTVTQFNEWAWIIIPSTILIGILIGAFSSFLAIRKHLKLKTVK